MTVYTSNKITPDNNISSLYDRSLDVYGLKIVASGAVGGSQAVPDEWVYKTARVVQLLLDTSGPGIDQLAQERAIKILSGADGTFHAGMPTAQQVGYGGGDSYSPNPLPDSGRELWDGLPKFLDSHATDDMIWYRIVSSPNPPKGDNDISELMEHILHTIETWGLRGAADGSFAALDPNNTNSKLHLAMKEAVDSGTFGLDGYGGSLDKDPEYTRSVIIKEYLYLLTFGMWGYSVFWDDGTLAPEWSDAARTPEGVQASNPLGYSLFNDYIAPVLSKPNIVTLRTMFQDNDQGESGYVWDTSETASIDIIVDKGILGAAAVMIKKLTKTTLKNGETLLSQAIEYQGQEFVYENIASVITIVTSNGEFTDEFMSEIKESFPQYGSLSYQEAVGLVGVANIDSALVSVAGADGMHVA
jgi:hypothetical protein